MRHNFQDFEKKFHGKVFVIFSIKEEIQNKDIYDDIEAEIKRLNHL
jgi:hypothetical protein